MLDGNYFFFFIQNQNKHLAVNPVKAVSASLRASFNFGSAARKRVFVEHVISIYVAVLPRNVSQGQALLQELQAQNVSAPKGWGDKRSSKSRIYSPRLQH